MAHPGQILENPASGERITIRTTSAQTDGELLAIDLELPAGRRVPGPLHTHPLQEERFEVVAGTMRFTVGRETVVAGPGEVVAVAPGVKHDFANAGDDDALVRVEVRPALDMERMFETAIALAEQGRTMMGGIPKPLDLALFAQEFKDEVRGAFPPFWLQQVVLRPLAWIARRLGRDDLYERRADKKNARTRAQNDAVKATVRTMFQATQGASKSSSTAPTSAI
jgi:quercetin dioxygenase-like cupin family protein